MKLSCNKMKKLNSKHIKSSKIIFNQSFIATKDLMMKTDVYVRLCKFLFSMKRMKIVMDFD